MSDFIKALHESEVGERLVTYLEGLQAEICDARNHTSGESWEAAKLASDILQKRVIDRIKYGGTLKDKEVEDFE